MLTRLVLTINEACLGSIDRLCLLGFIGDEVNDIENHRFHFAIHYSELLVFVDGPNASVVSESVGRKACERFSEIVKAGMTFPESVFPGLIGIDDLLFSLVDIDSRIEREWLNGDRNTIERLEYAISSTYCKMVALRLDAIDMAFNCGEQYVWNHFEKNIDDREMLSKSVEIQKAIDSYRINPGVLAEVQKLERHYGSLLDGISALHVVDRHHLVSAAIHLQFNRLLGLDGNRWEGAAVLALYRVILGDVSR